MRGLYQSNQLTIGEYFKGKYFEYDEDTEIVSKIGVDFKWKQFNKSGRGVGKGQDSNIDQPLTGNRVAKDEITIISSTDLPFKIHDRVTLTGLEVDGSDLGFGIEGVAIDRASTNALVNLQFGNSARYSPKILELR